ncbi:MAG: hypothetical protein J6S14_05640 [Clostridia bacterium]|nr:hypothetical protein [Clostridia bacterium]
MINFYYLAPTMRAVFSSLFFLTLCGGIYLISTMFKRRHSLSRSLIPVFTLVNGIISFLYLTEIRAGKQSKASPAIVEGFCRLPLIVPILLLIVTIVLYIYVLIRRYNYRQKYLTRSSIKAGLDKISSGLCFYHKNGRIVLVNHRMDQLCHAIVGRDLQNADLFWEILSKGEPKHSVTRLTDGFNPIFRLSDGSVWTFSQRELDGIIQLSASDITQLQEITDELKEKNVQLTALNERLKKYGENVDKLTRARERLEVKARIHRDLGQALLASRRFLLSEEESHPETLKIWRDNIAMLRMEAKAKEDEAPMEMLSRMISATGVNCEFIGELPDNRKAQKLFIQAAAEALTNAISHAEAKTLTITLTEEEKYYIARYTNDGTVPRTKTIKEGGGLSSLRKKIESEGGIMTVVGKPHFMLTVILAKGKGDIK